MDLSEFEIDVAKELTRRRLLQAKRRSEFGVWSDQQRRADIAEAWADLEAAYPGIERAEVAPAPQTLEREQIEKIGFSIWAMFHSRHGGEFNPDATDSPAITQTMAVADRAWAIAQVKPDISKEEINNIIRYTSKLAFAGDWMWLDILLEGLDVTRQSDLEIVCYARTCWSMRQHLEVYGEYLDRCRAALVRRGGDLAQLKGLEGAKGKDLAEAETLSVDRPHSLP